MRPGAGAIIIYSIIIGLVAVTFAYQADYFDFINDVTNFVRDAAETLF